MACADKIRAVPALERALPAGTAHQPPERFLAGIAAAQRREKAL